MSRNTSSAPSNPAKRRKTEASQSHVLEIEQVDLVVRTDRHCKKPFLDTRIENSPSFATSSLQLAPERKTCLDRKQLKPLQDIDDDTGLSKVLEQQRMATIQAQKEQANKPVKLSTLQCIICMENMKDLTATHCGTSSPFHTLTVPKRYHSILNVVLSFVLLGHLFCHACLMEALIAGENQGSEPGKGTPKCPVCRKKVVRPHDHRKGKDNHNVVPLAMKLKTKSRVNKGKGKAVDGDYD